MENADSLENCSFQNDTNSTVIKSSQKKDKLSSIPSSCFNYINSTVGAGVIFLCHAMQLSGFGFGTILTALAGVFAVYTSYLLVCASSVTDKNSYPLLVNHVLGMKFYIFTLICNFLLPFLTCVAYARSIAECITKVFEYLFPKSALLHNEVFIIFVMLILLSLPLSIPKYVSFLHYVSFLSILFVVFYTSVFIYKSTTIPRNILILPEQWNFLNLGFVHGLATTSLAFNAHHNVITMFLTLRDRSIGRFSVVSHSSVLFSAIIYFIIIVAGYFSFAGTLTGNLLNNYCVNDKLLLVTRILFSLTLVFTLPLQVISSRNVVFEILRSYLPNRKLYRIISTFVIHTLIFGLAAIPIDVTVFTELCGAFMSSALMYVIPSLVFMKCVNKSFKKLSIQTIFLWFLVVFGILLMVIGSVMAIISAFHHSKMIPRYWCPNFEQDLILGSGYLPDEVDVYRQLSLWNFYEQTISDRPRTNNTAEIWHREFFQLLGDHHPIIWKFIKGLK